ncbi:hypothetical protein H8959_018495 [Pygathrix nigripes]
MEVVEPSSPTEEEEEEEEHTAEPRPRTRSNPEGAEDRAVGAQASVGSRSEGEGEAASADDGSPNTSGAGPKSWQVPPPAPEVQIRTPRVNCPEKVIICLDLSEEMSLPKLESFNGNDLEMPRSKVTCSIEDSEQWGRARIGTQAQLALKPLSGVMCCLHMILAWSHVSGVGGSLSGRAWMGLEGLLGDVEDDTSFPSAAITAAHG